MSKTAAAKHRRQQHVSGRAQRRLQEQRQARQRRVLFLAGAVAVALIAAAALIVANRNSDGASTASLPAVVIAEPVDSSIPRDGRTLGDPNAPATLVEWADYQCPACGYFNQAVMPRLIDDYVKTGMLKIEFRDLPFLDNRDSGYGESDMAAQAAASAGEQGKFWEMHDTIFVNQHGENRGAFSKKRLEQMAQLLGLDLARFSASLNDRAHRAEIEAMEQEAGTAGIRSTPTLIVNGQTVRYTGNYEDLRAEIDAALAAS